MRNFEHEFYGDNAKAKATISNALLAVAHNSKPTNQ